MGDPCWLPAFTVRLRDSSKCICPMRSYKSVTVTCSESDAFEIVHGSSGSATHEMAIGKSTSDAAGPLEYDDVSVMRVWQGVVTLELSFRPYLDVLVLI